MSNEKFETKELSGQLMTSKAKTKESQPDYFGECKIDGKVYKIAGWTNKSKAGNKYLSLRFQDEEVLKGLNNVETEAEEIF